jgi:rRNA maturation protein Nop10
MECPDCGVDTGPPRGMPFDVDDALGDDNEAITMAEQRHYQLACQDCGAVVGYTGVAAAVGMDEG